MPRAAVSARVTFGACESAEPRPALNVDRSLSFVASQNSCHLNVAFPLDDCRRCQPKMKTN